MMCSDVHMYGSLLILYGSDDHCLSLRSISIPFCLLSLVRNVFNFLSNTGLYWTIFAWNRDTAVPVEGNGDLQTLICVVTARPRWCSTLSKLSSDKTDWQLIPATLHRWRCCFLADQLRSMARIWKKERKCRSIEIFVAPFQNVSPSARWSSRSTVTLNHPEHQHFQ